MKLLESRVWGWCLFPLSLIYWLIIGLRNRLYDRGVLRSERSGCRVISIGNITVGGTGKTPAVQLFATRLKAMGYHPAVLSRGYGRRESAARIVSDGDHVMRNVRDSGDEPMLLARSLPGIPVIVARRRIDGAMLIEKNWDCDCILLDDGFQHRRLFRNLDVVLIDASGPFGNGRLLPAGPCREPLSSLSRADAIFLTHISGQAPPDPIRLRIRKVTDAPLFCAKHVPAAWIRWPDGKAEPLSRFTNRTVLAFAGLGKPEGFTRTLAQLDVAGPDLIRFKDHHWYRNEDLDRLAEKARCAGAVSLITTEKDAMRLPENWKPPLPLYSLRISMETDQAIDPLIEGVLAIGKVQGRTQHAE